MIGDTNSKKKKKKSYTYVWSALPVPAATERRTRMQKKSNLKTTDASKDVKREPMMCPGDSVDLPFITFS